MMRALPAAVLVVALARAGCSPSPKPSPQPTPTPPAPVTLKGGVEVGWIARTPRLASPATVDAPVEAGWPEEGQAVTWIAHVINRGGTTLAAVPYQWRIGSERSSGIVDLPPGITEIRLPWLWTFARRQITFAIAPPSAADPVAGDNEVTIASDALSLMLSAERGVYDWLIESGRPGFEALFQREIVRWNGILAAAAHPTSPDGARDRIRLDHVQIVPDGHQYRGEDFLPWDLYWTFRTAVSDPRFIAKGVGPESVADQTIVLHELLHQRGLIDLYAYDVTHRLGTDAQVRITEGSLQVAGSFLMPAISRGADRWLLYAPPFNGLMGSDYRYPSALTAHSAFGLNMWAGRRTPLSIDRFGNLINQLGNTVFPGAYSWKLPAVTELTFVDVNGDQIAHPTVDVYADHHRETYRQSFLATPDRTLSPTAGSTVLLAGDILDGLPPTTWPPKAQVLIFGVRTAQARGYAFLPVYYLNLEYFKGRRERGAIRVPVTMHAR